jgi:hypothetical protein
MGLMDAASKQQATPQHVHCVELSLQQLLMLMLLCIANTLTCHYFDQHLSFPAGWPGEVCFLQMRISRAAPRTSSNCMHARIVGADCTLHAHGFVMINLKYCALGRIPVLEAVKKHNSSACVAAHTSCSTLGGPKLRNTAAAIVLAELRAAAATSGCSPLPIALCILCSEQLTW